MQTITGYSYERADYKNKKRILKHRGLLQDLFNEKAKEVMQGDYKNIKFRVAYKPFWKRDISTMKFTYLKRNREILSIRVKLSLKGLTKNVYYGYGNDYYGCRSITVNPYIIGNRKKARLFVLYHELYHAKQLLDNGMEKYIKLSQFKRELEADIFALSKITKKG